MIQRHEIKNKIAEILAEVNVQFDVLQQFDTDINVEILNAKIAYLANFSAILSKISMIEKIEGSFEFAMSEKVTKADKQILENTFKLENEPPTSVCDLKTKLVSDISEDTEKEIPEPFLIIKEVHQNDVNIVAENQIQQPLSIPQVVEEKESATFQSKFHEETSIQEKNEMPLQEKLGNVMETFGDLSTQSAVLKEVVAEKPNSINELFAQKKQVEPENSNIRLSMPIHDLKFAFSLNDRILFIRELFNGYNLAFSEVVEVLNEKKSFAEAKQFLIEYYFEKNQWATKDEVVQHFYNIIRNRYTV